MSGLEVLQKIKGINPNARMIIASGFIDADLRSKTVGLGAVGVIQKPFKPAELLNMLRLAIDGVEPLRPPIG